MSLVFDTNGHLTPYQPIYATLGILEAYFVQAFPHSQTRHRLFVHFFAIFREISEPGQPAFLAWINGSFVTRKENLNDIDCVIFLDYRIYEAQEPFLDQFWTFALEAEGLDAYLIKVFREDSTDYQTVTQLQKEY